MSDENTISKIREKIRDYYLEILDREPDPSGLEFYAEKVSSNEMKLEQISIILKNTNSYKELQKIKLKSKEYSSMIKKPILIFGVPRSGTTLLYRILCYHPDLAWFSHHDIKNWLTEDKQEAIKKQKTKLRDENKPVLSGEETLFVFGTLVQNPIKHTDKIPIEAETFWRKFFGPNFIKKVSVGIQGQILEHVAIFLQKEKKNRFLNKAPQNSMRLYALKQCFPDAKFINISREPREVISSMIQQEKNQGEFNTGIMIENSDMFNSLGYVEKWAWQYKEITEYIHDFSKTMNAENFLNVYYEELTRDPVQTLDKILKFCELRSEGIIGDMIPLIRDTSTKWKENLTDEDQKNIFQILEPVIQAMNYPYKL